MSSAAGSGGNPTEALKHFEAGPRRIKTARAGAAAAVDRVFPA